MTLAGVNRQSTQPRLSKHASSCSRPTFAVPIVAGHHRRSAPHVCGTCRHLPVVKAASNDVPEAPTPLQESVAQAAGSSTDNGIMEQAQFLQSTGATLPSSTQQERSDTTRALGVAAVVAFLAIVTESNKGWIASHQDLMMIAVFVAGYVGIIVEEFLGLNKAGVALLMAAALWSIRADTTTEVLTEAGEALSDVSSIIFFLIGAMTIVEVVDAHQGFKLVTDVIKTTSRTTLLWTVGLLAFFMSAVLDNLTTTIVMVSLLQKLCPDAGIKQQPQPAPAETRQYLGAVVVIAANAGGAWTPIGDVTTTMLWVGGQMSTTATVTDLVLPSAVSLLVPMALMTAFAPEVKGQLSMTDKKDQELALAPRGKLVLSLGLGSLLAVPVFKATTGLPPYMGMLAGLGFMWMFVDALHYGEQRKGLSVSSALKRIDAESVLFFLGILMAVSSLEAAGILKEAAEGLDHLVGRQDAVAALIGLASAVVDNVPLVAATMGMYSLEQYPVDSPLWQMIAYAAGTGGSLLIIGSAAGVAYMGMEPGAKFGWYLRKVTPWALIGYLAGFATYQLSHSM